LVGSFTGCAKEEVKRPKAKPPVEIEEGRMEEPVTEPEIFTPQRKASDRIIEKGKLELDLENYEHALRLFQDAVNVDSANGVAYYYLALTNVKMEQEDQALGLLDKAEALLQHDPRWLTKVLELRSSLTGEESSSTPYYPAVEEF
jgi:tetratricopeptide (TPR) repeat protein